MQKRNVKTQQQDRKAILSKADIGRFFGKTGIFWALFLLVIVLSLISSSFFTGRNLLNILKQASITSILAIGMTFVLLSGGIDLSVGSVVALSSIFAAFVGVNEGYPLILCFVASIFIGAVCGLINGFGVAYIGFPPFVMTLGMMGIARSLAKVITEGKPIFGVSKPFASVAGGVSLGVPNLVYFMIIVFLISLLVLRKSVFGRHVYAIGGNKDSARLSGVNVKLSTMAVYIICGALAGLCGMLMASRITSGNPTAAEGYEMDAIAAAVIGGVSMTGGAGGVLGTIVGAFILIIIQNGFDILGIQPHWNQFVQGAIILLAVLLDIKSKKKI